jgi:pimeloyl-[acyl-carrier protein] synthase
MNGSTDFSPAVPDQLLEDHSFYKNPYPALSRLRDEAPVYWHQASRTWLVTRYDDVDFVLRSPKLFSNYGFQNSYFENLLPELRAAAPTMELRGRSPSLLTSDPPAHTRLRRLLNIVFSPKAIEELRPRVQALVQRLLDETNDEDVIDFVVSLAHPLPAMLIADIMGVPREDHDVFKKVSGDLLDFMNRPNPNAELTVEFAREADSSLACLRDYLRGIMADRRRNPRNDVISVLSQADFDGDRLTEEELLSNMVLFLIAGHETTTSLIANGVLLFARHPDQLRALRVRRELMIPAIEEIMRFESPVQRQRRIVAQDMELGGASLRKGQQLEVLLGSANRDRSRWENPDQFDIQRKPVAHIAFGKGIHFCIGAPLARLEAQVVFNDLLNRFSTFDVPAGWEPQWMANTNLRKPNSLPVRIQREP